MYPNLTRRKATAWITLMLLFFLTGWTSCNNNAFTQGEILYTNFCSNCHMSDGSGLVGNIPPLAGADYIKNDPVKMACIIRYGISDSIIVNGKSYGQPMAGIPALSDFEIANIINYINHSWGNNFGYVQIGEVQEALNNCMNEK